MPEVEELKRKAEEAWAVQWEAYGTARQEETTAAAWAASRALHAARDAET